MATSRTPPPALRASFLAALAEVASDGPDEAAGRGAAAADPELEPLLAELCAEAAQAWPEVELPAAAFMAHLARHLPRERDEEGAAATSVAHRLRALRAADLYLACACAAGDERAIAVFERTYLGEIDAAAARLRAGPDLAAEVRQRLRRVLFVAEETRPAATADYAGRGDLRGWLRISAVREVQHLLAKERREVKLGDETLFDVLSPADDPELGYLRDLYRDAFADAFRAALAATGARDRSLLRYQLIDGLSIDELGAMHAVHRATAARWLAAARAGILERTRAELAARLGIGDQADVDSLIRLLHSRLDVSVERVLLGSGR